MANKTKKNFEDLVKKLRDVPVGAYTLFNRIPFWALDLKEVYEQPFINPREVVYFYGLGYDKDNGPSESVLEKKLSSLYRENSIERSREKREQAGSLYVGIDKAFILEHFIRKYISNGEESLKSTTLQTVFHNEGLKKIWYGLVNTPLPREMMKEIKETLGKEPATYFILYTLAGIYAEKSSASRNGKDSPCFKWKNIGDFALYHLYRGIKYLKKIYRENGLTDNLPYMDMFRYKDKNVEKKSYMQRSLF